MFKFLKRSVTKEKLDSKISRFISRFGKTKEIKEVEKLREQEELKDRFLGIFMKIGFARDKAEKQELIKKAKETADKTADLKGWPEKAAKFWDVEAAGWKAKIPYYVRQFIRKELLRRIPPGGLNLSLGPGSYPYIEESVLVDISEEMLKAAEPTVKFKKKIVHDLDKGYLPFKNNSFDTVTMVFVVNYLRNPEDVFREIYRVLKKKGKLIIVQSAKMLDDWYAKQEKKQYKAEELKKLLAAAGFMARIEKKKVKRTKLIFAEFTK
jgi:SAM-dependent methyltransferase